MTTLDIIRANGIGWVVRRARTRGPEWVARWARRAAVACVRALIGYVVLLVLVPLALIRRTTIVKLRADRIGHLAYNTDVYLRRRALQAGARGRAAHVVGLAVGPVANSRLLSVLTRQVPVLRTGVPAWILGCLGFTHATSFFEDLDGYNDTAMKYAAHRAAPSNIVFTQQEEQEGRALLDRIGISAADWFICFHARDPSYLSVVRPDLRSTYHSYRDCSIDNYLSAATYIAEKGGFALRMGQVVDAPLADGRHPRIIDYATQHRTEWGDVYLPARCRFFLGCTAGLFMVPLVAGRPLACANFYLELINPFNEGDLFIPKKIWSTADKRLLTFREILDCGAGRWTFAEQYARAGLEVIENTAEEILALTREMDARLDGTFQSTEEDEELQRRFHALFKPHHCCYGTPVRLGAEFLRQHQELLN